MAAFFLFNEKRERSMMNVAGRFVTLLELSFWKDLPSCSHQFFVLNSVSSAREVSSRMTFLKTRSELSREGANQMCIRKEFYPSPFFARINFEERLLLSILAPQMSLFKFGF
jgi:hypothetical protein